MYETARYSIDPLFFPGFNIADLSGGDLKNVALNAAGIAAKENSPKIMKNHIEEAITLVKAAKNVSGTGDTRYIA